MPLTLVPGQDTKEISHNKSIQKNFRGMDRSRKDHTEWLEMEEAFILQRSSNGN